MCVYKLMELAIASLHLYSDQVGACLFIQICIHKKIMEPVIASLHPCSDQAGACL